MAANASWKRRGSPIGKTGPRKANPKYKQRAGMPWSDAEVKSLRSLARANTPTGVLSLKLRRPIAAIRRSAVKLRPVSRNGLTEWKFSSGRLRRRASQRRPIPWRSRHTVTPPTRSLQELAQ